MRARSPADSFRGRGSGGWLRCAARDGVECPSLSPDGTRIAFKQRVGSGIGPSRWPALLDVATLEDHPLTETRNVDDQIEWLDDTTVLYLDTGFGAPDTWSVPATGEPVEFLADADSPAVVRLH